MKNFKDEWNKMSLNGKILYVVQTILAVATIIFYVLFLFAKNKVLIILQQVMFLSFMLIQTIRTRKGKKVVFILNLCAMLLTLCCVLIWIFS